MHVTCSGETHIPTRTSGKSIPGRGNSMQEVRDLGLTPNPPVLLQLTTHTQVTSAHP